MAPNTNPFWQRAESMSNGLDLPDSRQTTASVIGEGAGAEEALPAAVPNPATLSTDPESRKSFPEHLPYRMPQQPLWNRLWRNNKLRIAIGTFCFLVVVGGTIAGAFFLANVMRTGMFHPSSDAGLRDAPKTSYVILTTVVPGLGEMGPVTETVSSMQETHLLTQWIVSVPKTTTTPVMPTKAISGP
jgi:hypothetical protein